MAEPNDMMNMNSAENQQFLNPENQEKKPSEGNEYAQLAALITDLDRRLRTLEERYTNLRKKLQLTDQNLLDSERSFGKELKEVNDSSMEMKRTVNDFSDKIIMFESELSNVAQKKDLMVVEKYFSMWNPMNFVTRKELREYLKNKSIKLLDKDEE